ncbi:hypothetical protein V6N13_126454 [Hibiscus sabdariffa]|uniref:Uncharacterized protein n=1 Tax=Hibiscus sabdariffa TaxID=183260 RepID=A0ABR2RFM0_9ROSI
MDKIWYPIKVGFVIFVLSSRVRVMIDLDKHIEILLFSLWDYQMRNRNVHRFQPLNPSKDKRASRHFEK